MHVSHIVLYAGIPVLVLADTPAHPCEMSCKSTIGQMKPNRIVVYDHDQGIVRLQLQLDSNIKHQLRLLCNVIL